MACGRLPGVTSSPASGSSPGPPGATTLVWVLGIAQTLAWAFSTDLPAILATSIARDLGMSRAAALALSGSVLLLALACLLGLRPRRVK